MRVTADRAFAASRNGELIAFVAGDVVEGDWAEYLATTGAPVTVVEETSSETSTPPPSEAPTPPPVSATKAAWVEHAVAQGVDAAAAAAMTKQALVEAHGPTTE